MTSANWFGGPLVLQPQSEMTTGFQYTTPNGTKRSITVAGVGELSHVFDLLNHKNWTMLATFPDGVSWISSGTNFVFANYTIRS